MSAAPVVTLASPVLCPHGGLVSFVPSVARLTASGAPVLTVDAASIVSGCPNTAPGPCVRVEWQPSGSTLTVEGREVLTMSSSGIALTAEGVPVGAPTIAGGDPRVVA